jgi:hypothetical protein
MLSARPSFSISPAGRWVAAPLLALLVLLLLPGAGHATILWHMTIEDLTASSDVVVIADVQDQWVEWDHEDHQIHTYTRVRIERVLTPEATPESEGVEVVIEQDGGFLADWGVEVAGNAILVPGERALLFLLRGEHYYVHGMEQGKYTIVQASGDVPRVLRPATVPVATQPLVGTHLQIERPVVEMNGRTLDEMLRRVSGNQR